MIPLKDTIPSKKFPAVNIAIILANVLIFLYQQTLAPRELYYFVARYGTVPQQVTGGFQAFLSSGFNWSVLWPVLLTLITANFLHGGWLHLIGNMLYLWVFGDNIEGCLGHPGYLITYLFMGMGGQLLHLISAPFSPVPVIGASGAIAGVLGAYLILYPHSRVLTLVPLGFFITLIRIPAVIFLALWFLLQLSNAFTAGIAPEMQAVAWWAHIGGFIIGVVVGLRSKRKNRA